jgi:GNAT superfamily N-acetyltransferase
MYRILYRELDKLSGRNIIEASKPYVVLATPEEHVMAAAEIGLYDAGKATTPLPEMILGLIVVPPEERRRGFATKLMKLLIQVADRHGWAMSGFVRPWQRQDVAKPPMSDSALRRWYRKLGFIVEKEGGIVRLPGGHR